MKEVACFSALLFVVLVEGQTSQPAHNVQCYKKTTDFDEDFTCTWRPVTPLQNATYKLFYHHVFLLVGHPASTQGTTRFVPHHTPAVPYSVSSSSPHGRYTCGWKSKQRPAPTDQPNSPCVSIIKSEEHRGAVYEISLKQLDHEHLVQETFETNDGQNTQENYTVSLHLEHNTNYEVMIRRRAKQVEAEIWSDWSQIKQVPTELDSQPKVKWKVQKLKKGVRLLELMLEEYSRNATFGGLMYQISTSPVPCWHDMDIVYTESTNYKLSIAASTVNVTVRANNSVGVSPETHITIPAQYLDTCPENRSKTTTNNKKRMELCVVWYRLTGETPKLADENHSTVKSTSQAFEIMNAEMEDFVRYHYFIYTKAKRGKQQITDMCPVYKKEGAPRSSPGSLTALNKTHNSAVLQWEPIPVSEQRGFLKNYIIYILGPNGTETVKVPGSQSNFTMQNLKHSSVYSVHLAGQTSVGVGPNTTETFQMKPNPPTKKGLPSFSVVTVTCLVAFFLMAFCILIVKCISDKLLPAVPSPVIPETPSYHTENHKEAYPVGEEVDSLILQLYEPSGGGGSEPRQMEVEVCRTPSYEQDDGESQSDSEEPDESSLALNPDYKKQILSGPAQLSHQQNRCDAIPAYKNGLVLEMRENASEELTESWPALG
ncbi:oncostatin-M-specific receptor subunit beta isoform X2 [Paramormyrops kingsleyae]|uniref:oncostatin-M-specific receptor subunit beta isoform X2 n=1 Tax=Paramormyrops kingsleyae TaxID=1676925 RepID=UPI000CD64891|nr:interleukin-12 receptor subunit beta-1 isoform X2 [Paramormyrops kingsleyae]